METFAEPRPFVENPGYSRDRDEVLEELDLRSLDEPVVGLVAGFNALPFCFTLQSCCGHFITAAHQDDRSLDLVPAEHEGPVRYRIAYMAFCVENTAAGRAFRDGLERIAAIDPDYFQFGSADWFWEQHSNTYALQVEPVRFMRKDEAVLDHAEALHVQERRDLLFVKLEELLESMSGEG